MRHVKQLLYGIFYLAILSALFGGIYFLQRPAPTCFDNKKNQDEAGIDCGGVCAKVCIPSTISSLAQSGDPVLILLAVPSSSQAAAPRISALSEIQNPNADFGATSFEYIFRIYDRSGAELASFPGRSFIYPGEIKRLAVLNEAMPAGSDPASASLSIWNPIWAPLSRFPRPAINIQSAKTSEANGNLVTQGVFVNQDSIDFSTVYLTAVYSDQNGKVVGVSGTERGNVSAGESREFALFHPSIPNAIPEKTQVFVAAFGLR